MFRHFFRVLFFIPLVFNKLYAGSCEEINYEWLIMSAKQNSYADHIPHFRRLFNTIPINCFLECGCGYSTKYFLDHCENVISIEFIASNNNDLWFKKCQNLYQNYSNWTPLVYYGSPIFNRASHYQLTSRKDYAPINSSYLTEIDLYFKELISENTIEIAFVDPGVYVRGNMVNLLLENKIPIVVAHDTKTDNGQDGIYGWNTIRCPENYVKVYIPFNQGTTFWIRNDIPKVIESISSYRDQVIHYKEKGNLSFETLTTIADQI